MAAKTLLLAAWWCHFAACDEVCHREDTLLDHFETAHDFVVPTYQEGCVIVALSTVSCILVSPFGDMGEFHAWFTSHQLR